MYKLMSGDKLIGVFQKVVFIRKVTETIVAGGIVYAITNSTDYQDCEQVAVFELDSEVERTAELDYMRVMANLI